MAKLPSTIVKIGIQLYSNGTKLSQLKEFDLNNTIVSFIEDVCKIWGLSSPGKYVLRFPEEVQRNYVSESNKNEIKDGLLMILDLRPHLAAKLIISNLQLSIEFKVTALKELTHLSKYKDFAQEFVKEKGINYITEIIEQKKFKPTQLGYALFSFTKLMEHKIIPWKIMDAIFTNQIVKFLTDDQFYDPLIICLSLKILKNYVTYDIEKGVPIQKDVLVSNLIMRIKSYIGINEPLKFQVISFINVLFKFSSLPECKMIGAAILSNNVRNIIWLITSQAENLPLDLSIELHTLQRNCLNLIQYRIGKIDRHSQYARVLMRELSRIAAKCEEQIQSETCKSESGTNKIGFVNDSDPISDLNKKDSPGALALDCMVYFARNYAESYTSIILENNCICEKYQCLFGKSSIELVSLLCGILKTMPTERRFYPMFYNHPHPFEELFCSCIMMFTKTWKEMKATSEDSNKVFAVVKEQIVQGLLKFSLSFEEFRHGIKSLTYMDISDLWHHKRTVSEKRKSVARPVIQLKQAIKPEIMNLIKEHRLSLLVKGKTFSKLNTKGMIVKNKFWFIRLSPNHTFFQYGDCTAESIPTLDELDSVVPVTNIKNLTLLKSASNAKDKKNDLFSFSIAILTDGNTENLGFVTREKSVFEHWTDGLNALLQYEMTSKACTEDFNTLMTMEIRLRLLDIEDINIPEIPPPIPPPPSDYNFQVIDTKF